MKPREVLNVIMRQKRSGILMRQVNETMKQMSNACCVRSEVEAWSDGKGDPETRDLIQTNIPSQEREVIETAKD